MFVNSQSKVKTFIEIIVIFYLDFFKAKQKAILRHSREETQFAASILQLATSVENKYSLFKETITITVAEETL